MNKKDWILAVKVALVVGTALNLINNYEAIFALQFNYSNVLKICFTYCVPFGVSLYSSKKASRA